MIRVFGLFAVLLTAAIPLKVSAYEQIEVVNGGTISGRGTFKGEVPETMSIPVVKNREFCGKSVWDPVLVVNPSNRGLKNTVVYLESVGRGKRLPKNQFIDAFKCLFVPHATVIIKDRPVMFHNNDTVFHNAHVMDDQGRTIFNFALPNLGAVVHGTVKTAGVLRIQCDSHVHMNGWAISLNHPYFSVTDDSGRYKISDVPPGKYRLVAWHEGYIMTNRQDQVDSFRTNPDSLTRPVYDPPFEVKREIEVETNGLNKENFDLEAR